MEIAEEDAFLGPSSLLLPFPSNVISTFVLLIYKEPQRFFCRFPPRPVPTLVLCPTPLSPVSAVPQIWRVLFVLSFLFYFVSSHLPSFFSFYLLLLFCNICGGSCSAFVPALRSLSSCHLFCSLLILWPPLPATLWEKNHGNLHLCIREGDCLHDSGKKLSRVTWEVTQALRKGKCRETRRRVEKTWYLKHVGSETDMLQLYVSFDSGFSLMLWQRCAYVPVGLRHNSGLGWGKDHVLSLPTFLFCLIHVGSAPTLQQNC